MGDASGVEYEFTASHGVLLDHIYLGAGLGVNNPFNRSQICFPLYLNIKGIWEDKSISPAFDVKAGVAGVGYFGEAGAGCRFSTGQKTAILLSAYFRYKHDSPSIVASREPGSLPNHLGRYPSIGLKAAFEF